MSEFLNDSFDSGDELKEDITDTSPFLENAKLIGESPTGLKIYLEDYVYTYLYKYAKFYRGEERAAALIGTFMEDSGQMCAVISGAVQIPPETKGETGELFLETHLEEIQKQMEKYFPDKELMGWMHTQPGYGIFLTTQDLLIQKKYFKEAFQTLMIIDPIEDMDAFFAWEREELRSVKGYYLYYHKNEQMQNYMIANKIGLSSEELNDREDVVMHFRKKDRMRRQEIQNKKIMRMVTTLSCVLFLMCATMAVNLIQYKERLARLETELDHIGSNYSDILKRLDKENLQVVFAEENIEDIITETEEYAVISAEATEIDKGNEDNNKNEENTANADHENREANNETKEETAEPEAVDYYTVQKGDNLIKICYQHYKTTNMLGKIVEMNNLESPNKIYEGQVLKLPRLQ